MIWKLGEAFDRFTMSGLEYFFRGLCGNAAHKVYCLNLFYFAHKRLRAIEVYKNVFKPI